MSLNIGFLIFDDVTQLDFTGPLQVLSRIPDAQIYIVAKELRPIQSDCGPFLMPSHTPDTCPPLDVICVPGGFGIDAVMEDEALLNFLRTQAEGARYVTSVCTGAFVLGAAGLLKGVKATTHWAYHEALSAFGAEPVNERVVRDGRFMTGGGVTAGIDFGLVMAREIAGDTVASAIQLGVEYDPAPVLDSGHPDRAHPALVEAVKARLAPRIATFNTVVERIADRTPA